LDLSARKKGLTASADRRDQIDHLQQALDLADELGDGNPAYLIERALDKARSRPD
jgi:hypothetical protein